MAIGVGQVDAVALGVAGAHENAQFQFVIQAGARAELRRVAFVGGTGLAHGARKLLVHADAGGAAVVADGHPLVVRQQGVVRTELLANGGGVVHRDVEVGVVADARGRGVLSVGLRNQ
ncbi:hypothetical protein D3C73_1231830 [compost metagenome]